MNQTLNLFDQFREHTGDSVSAAVVLLAHVLSNPKPVDGSLTVREAATFLGVAEKTVYDLCRTSRLRHHRIGRGRGTIRLSRGDLETFRQDAQHEPEDLFSKHVSA